ncbi:Integrase core domain protein [compost metagenome]
MKYSHLSLDDRKIIQEGIESELTKVEIARLLKKDPTTIGKEIRSRRKLKPRNIFNNPITCTNFKKCGICHGRCTEYQEIICLRRDRNIGACNLCPSSSKCRLDKYFYNALKAHEKYLYTLKDSREGVNLTTSEMLKIVDIIKPLLKRGQSIYQIHKNHSELKLSSKSLYTYIETGVFQDYGINNFSLRRQVSMKKRKKLKKRKEPVNYNGRRYSDYLELIKENPTLITTEMDTVYNHAEGPYIQTFIFENTGFMIGFLHNEKTSDTMASTLDKLQETLEENYFKLFSLLLTDRGTEFEKHDLFEVNIETGEIRSKIFYCDPQTPSQKPHVENNHNYVRTIIPNGKKLRNLTQEDLELMFSHINSTPRKSLNGKTPYEAFEFLYGNEILTKLHMKKIEKDMVTLQPYLLKIQ